MRRAPASRAGPTRPPHSSPMCSRTRSTTARSHCRGLAASGGRPVSERTCRRSADESLRIIKKGSQVRARVSIYCNLPRIPPQPIGAISAASRPAQPRALVLLRASSAPRSGALRFHGSGHDDVRALRLARARSLRNWFLALGMHLGLGAKPVIEISAGGPALALPDAIGSLGNLALAIGRHYVLSLLTRSLFPRNFGWNRLWQDLRHLRHQAAINRQIAPRRFRPAKILGHGLPLKFTPDERLLVERERAVEARQHFACVNVVEGKPCCLPSRDVALGGIDHRIAQPARAPDHRQGPITHGVELRQAAGLIAGGMQQDVAARKEQMRQRLLIADARRDLAGILAGRPVELVLEMPVAVAEQYALRTRSRNLG